MIASKQINIKRVAQWIEPFAVVANLLFTYLYIQQSPWCFLFGILGPLLLMLPLFQTRLFAEVGLQCIYILLAVFGLFRISDNWQVVNFANDSHLLLVFIGIFFSVITGLVLKRISKASVPFVDSATTVFSIIATVLMMIPVHEAWLYFICINFVSIIMYAYRKLFFGAMMFFIYLIMSIDAYFTFGIFS